MNFEPTLRKMIDGVPGALGIALMGSDGIPIAEVQPQHGRPAASGGLELEEEGGAEATGELEVGAAGVEFGRVLDEIRKAADGLGAGRLEESLVGFSRYWLLFRVVDDELFLVAALEPRGNLGKARFLMRRHLLELREQL
jgi:predicted regulator of Ras-like GTPase activity (Roadblock/LC7/MglB family)